MREGLSGRRRRRGLLTLAAAAGLLAFPGQAAATPTIFGADLKTLSPNISAANNNITNVRASNTEPDNGAPVSGVLTSVRIKTTSIAGGDGVIRVLTQAGHPNATTYQLLDDGPEIPVHVAGGTDLVTEVATRRPITFGQRLGIRMDDPSAQINDMHNFGRSVDLCAYSRGDPSGTSQDVGTTLAYSTATCHDNLTLVSGTIEPDADGDGFGDDTQDACPISSATQAACPASGSTATPEKKCKKKHKKHAAGIAKKKCKKRKKGH